jgi:hypothetical protein
VLVQFSAEIDQQPHSQIQRLEVRQHLLAMERFELRDGFELDQDESLDQQVDCLTGNAPMPVLDLDALLGFERHPRDPSSSWNARL